MQVVPALLPHILSANGDVIHLQHGEHEYAKHHKPYHQTIWALDERPDIHRLAQLQCNNRNPGIIPGEGGGKGGPTAALDLRDTHDQQFICHIQPRQVNSQSAGPAAVCDPTW
jgi:hypothetical protein